jgi:hypothetical protein
MPIGTFSQAAAKEPHGRTVRFTAQTKTQGD